ncbi:MAG TPA: hypothetical protein VK843_01100 [Planctomycetota bacterium]|nr:hypothetical protein [Planctomycetota bacterium]
MRDPRANPLEDPVAIAHRRRFGEADSGAINRPLYQLLGLRDEV